MENRGYSQRGTQERKGSGKYSGTETGRRSGAVIMGRLIGLVKPLWFIIALAVLFGSAGYLCAIFLTILAAGTLTESISLSALAPVLVGLAVLRGVLHYAEQYCNHFIAFRLLAILRHKIFASLCRLCPAKLEGKDRGNLISVITSDIELLEVFYAHTISPIAIAVVTELVMIVFFAAIHPASAVLAVTAYVTLGAVIPLWNGRKSGGTGMEFRNAFGEFNSFLLDSFRGIDETLQYGQGEKRKHAIQSRAFALGKLQKNLNHMEGNQRAVTNLAILAFSLAMLLLSLLLYGNGHLEFSGVILCTTAMMSSFGPVSALSSLSNNLNQTLASGERVLSILEETPAVEEVAEKESMEEARHWTETFSGAETKKVCFGYERPEETDCEKKKWILHHYDFLAESGKITGIHGPSGCGKSTLLKLLMRFWDADRGEIRISAQNVKEIPTSRLRNTESYVTQETHLFHDSIAANIAIGKPGASMEEIREAARKASVDTFIMTLPNGYDTQVGELGDTLSGGERQRIGIARAFLHDAPFLLLDEPTSNLDSLNEGIILKSLKEESAGKTVILISHRESTMQVADKIVKMETAL